MSTLPDNEFDLEKLFLPSWAQEPSSTKSYAQYEGETERPDRREGRRGPRPPRREGAPGGRREEGRGERRGPRPGGPGGPGRGPRPDRPGQERGPRPERAGFERGGRGPRRGGPPPERREPPPPPPEINVSLVPDEKGVESLARQIRMTGRAYPLFDIAQMILQKPERHNVVFSIKKNAEGQPIQPLFQCALDDTLWLTEDEAVAHVLKKHFATFYQAEKTPTEPPKGKYTFVAQCGMSGIIFGPPNYHDYQNQLRKLHSERFSRMPFEVYKSRVRIVRDEEVVKKWVEDQSWKTDYTCLNVPEAMRLGSMDAVEKHFREVHKDSIIKQVESQQMSGTAARNLRSAPLTRMVRQIWEDQRRFPLQIATVLSQQFASHGLQFFKVNKTITHVSVARPHYLDMEATPVSEGVKKIVEYINAHPKSNRRHLLEALAPAPAPVAPVAVPAEPQPAPAAPAAEAPAEPAPTPEVQAEAQAPVSAESPAAPEPQAAEAAAPAPAPAAPPPAEPEPAQPSPEQTAIIADLHWLIHQGHVIEFATGVLETAKKPLPKPPKPEKVPEKAVEAAPTGAPGEGAAPAATPEGATATEPAPAAPTEGAPQPEAAAPVPVPAEPVATPGSEPIPAPGEESTPNPAPESKPEPGSATAPGAIDPTKTSPPEGTSEATPPPAPAGEEPPKT